MLKQVSIRILYVCVLRTYIVTVTVVEIKNVVILKNYNSHKYTLKMQLNRSFYT